MNKIELYYEVASNQEKAQHERSRHFDQMATTIFASSGVIASIMAFTVNYWVWWSWIPAMAVLITFIMGAFCSIRTIWLRKWKSQPNIRDLATNISNYDDSVMLTWTAKQISDAVKENENPLTDKAKWLRLSYIFLAVQVIFLTIVIISVRS